jgi:four helix bundle protein
MFLDLAYKTLDLYTLSKKLVVACYELTHSLPEDEKNNMTRQIREAALTCYANIVRGLFRKSKKKRRKHFKQAKESLQIIDASLELLLQLNYIKKEQLNEVENSLTPCYGVLNKLLKK